VNLDAGARHTDLFPAPNTSAETHPRVHVASRGVSDSPRGQGRLRLVGREFVTRQLHGGTASRVIPNSTHRRHKPSAGCSAPLRLCARNRRDHQRKENNNIFLPVSLPASCSAPSGVCPVRVWRSRRETWARSVLSGTARAEGG